MPRGVREPSKVFQDVLSQAAQQLALDSRTAKNYQHKGIRGDERAGALIHFLSEHVPADFDVCKGEVIDYRDERTGQLDIIIYDKSTSAPIHVGTENLLLPCESLYAVIEVKTILTQVELNTSFAAANKVRQLEPFKSNFVGPRADGAAANDKMYRCLYAIFAYETDLGVADWLTKEFGRIKKAAHESTAPLDVVERIVVLDRGMINPFTQTGKLTDVDRQSIFLEFYVHLMNFLNREHSRRPGVDWQCYSARTDPGWTKIE
jgi:hypothetical protein